LKFLESCNIEQPTLERLVEFLRSRQESKKTVGTGHTTGQKWNDFSEIRKCSFAVPMSDDKCNGRIVSNSKFRFFRSNQGLCPPLSSQTELVFKCIDEEMQINNSPVPPTDLDPSLVAKSTKSSARFKTVQHNPVSLSLNVYSNIQTLDSCCSYLDKTNLSSSLSTSSSCENYEDIDQPLNLCCKHSIMDEDQGVWRPW